MKVEDWQPLNKYGTTGAAGAETSKSVINLNLNSLKAWPDIEELKNVSGVEFFTVVNRVKDLQPRISHNATIIA